MGEAWTNAREFAGVLNELLVKCQNYGIRPPTKTERLAEAWRKRVHGGNFEEGEIRPEDESKALFEALKASGLKALREDLDERERGAAQRVGLYTSEFRRGYRREFEGH
jgi:hypothetical protein